MPEYRSASGSAAEDLFIDLFAETFGAEKAGYLYSQYPFYDIYQNARFADFVLENGATRVAIEIDDEASHNPRLVSHTTVGFASQTEAACASMGRLMKKLNVYRFPANESDAYIIAAETIMIRVSRFNLMLKLI